MGQGTEQRPPYNEKETRSEPNQKVNLGSMKRNESQPECEDLHGEREQGWHLTSSKNKQDSDNVIFFYTLDGGTAALRTTRG